MNSRVSLDISLKILRQNYIRIAEAVAPCTVIVVLKANAYGLGVEGIAGELAAAGATRFAVAELNEALALKSLDCSIQILGSVLPGEIEAAIEASIVLPVSDMDTASRINEEAARQGRKATCQVLVDTGMGRLGVLADHTVDFLEQVMALPHVICEGIYSHFPMAYRSGSDYTQAQIQCFKEVLHACEERGIALPWRHMANSDAINNFPETYRPPFNAVRTGINLHGSFDIEGQRCLDLRPVLTLRTKLASVRRLPAGTYIGYGCTYRLPRDMLVGTICAGYADGLPLALSNRGYVLIGNQPCPVLGRVSMDYTTISLEQVPDAVTGDDVICLGGEGSKAISVEDWAQLKGTHPYEIICSFGSRVERRYVE